MIFAATALLSAFCVFWIQPLAGRFLLPWFGGSAGVWTTCLLFFQLGLLGSYAWAHLGPRWLGPRAHALVHVLLAAGAVATLSVVPGAAMKPEGSLDPTGPVLVVLAGTVGPAYFVLAATAPLLQTWLAGKHLAGSPYRLYAFSNAGSLLAVVAYPFVIEPAAGVVAQARAWSWCFGACAAGCAACCLVSWKRLGRHGREPAAAGPRIAPRRIILWSAGSCGGSVALLAVTNEICHDIAVVPLLWVAPLGVYLLSYVLVFAGRYAPGPWRVLAVVAVGVGTALQLGRWPIGVAIGGHLFFLLGACMVMHGEVAARRPETGRSSLFYLALAAGGAAGGVLVGVAAPALFAAYFETHLCLLGTAIWLLVVCGLDPRSSFHGARKRLARNLAALWLSLVAAALAVVVDLEFSDARVVTRSFHGVLRVNDVEPDHPTRRHRLLVHGRIIHGLQLMAPGRRRAATAYYGPGSGVAQAIAHVQKRGPVRFGIVGLGTGTLLAYGRRGDLYRFYELDPMVWRVARRHFTLLDESPACFEVVLGDARVALEREEPQRFDLLAVDAFSGDAVPVHLLTVEALAVYVRHLAPGGIVAFNLSNRHLDLRPAVAAAATRLGLAHASVEVEADDELFTFGSNWMLVGVRLPRLEGVERRLRPRRSGPWTDDRSDVFGALR